MAESENIVLEVNFDVGKMEDSLTDINAGFKEMHVALNSMAQAINNGFDGNVKAIQRVESGVQSAGKTVSDTVKNSIEAVASVMGSIVGQLESIFTSMGSLEKIVAGNPVVNAVSFTSDLTGIFSNLKDVKDIFGGKGSDSSTTKGKQAGSIVDVEPKTDNHMTNTVVDVDPFKNINSQLLLPGPVDSNYKGTETDGLVSGLAMQMGNLASSGGSMETLAAGLEAVRIKLQEVTRSWSEYALAKKDDLATDIKIVAGYVGDFAKSIAGTVAHLATSTAAWVGNTAAKVASTAAEWAQIAATTAWKAICVAATAVTTAFGAAISFLTSPIGLVVAAIAAVIAVVALLIKNWDDVAAAAKTVWGFVQQKFMDFSSFMSGVFAADWSAQFGAFGHVLNGFLDMVEGIFTVVKSIFSGIIGFITGVFSGNWQKAWSSIVGLFKGIWDGVTAVIKAPLNGLIGIINGLLRSACNGINGIIKLLNGLKFTIPDWVPGIGGSGIGFNIQQLTPPQIPYLARGAVLPANRPFLAVVGDQRHGTNVEAPLATIQEAVAVVMENHISAMMAGFQALLAEQQALRQCVEGIEIGDDVIGQATARYNRKMAMVRGGY